MEFVTTGETAKRNIGWLRIAIFAMLLLVLLPQAWHRPVDRDEGFWLNSARLLTHNMLPYEDFPLPHAPLLPYFYSFWCNFLGWTLPAARLLSILFTITLLIVVEMTAGARHQQSSLIALLLLGLSSAFINWHVPIKIYAFFNLAVFCSWAAFEWARLSKSSIPMVISGVAMGLAFAVRITTLALLILPLVFIWQIRPRRGKPLLSWLAGAGLYIVGLCIGFLPALNLYTLTWPLGYEQAWLLHQGILGEKSVLGRFYAPWELAVQTPDAAVLLGVSLIAGVMQIVRGRGWRQGALAPLAFILALSVVAMAPGSAVGQYFSTTIPFAAVLAAPLSYDLITRARGWWKPIWQLALAGLMILGVFRFPWHVMNNYQDKALIGTEQVALASHALAAMVPPDGTVVAFWPGYNALSDRPVVRGTELGKFTMRLGEALPPEQWSHFRLAPDSAWEGMIARGEVAAVVAGIDSPLDNTDPKTQADPEFVRDRKDFLELVGKHYEDQGIFGGARIYTLRQEKGGK